MIQPKTLTAIKPQGKPNKSRANQRDQTSTLRFSRSAYHTNPRFENLNLENRLTEIKSPHRAESYHFFPLVVTPFETGIIQRPSKRLLRIVQSFSHPHQLSEGWEKDLRFFLERTEPYVSTMRSRDGSGRRKGPTAYLDLHPMRLHRKTKTSTMLQLK